jgi:hypothetical protein
MSASTPMRARPLLTFLVLAAASVRSLSCEAQLEPISVVSPASAVHRTIDAYPDETMLPSVLPGVARSVSAVLDPRVASAAKAGAARSRHPIPLGLRN